MIGLPGALWTEQNSQMFSHGRIVFMCNKQPFIWILELENRFCSMPILYPPAAEINLAWNSKHNLDGGDCEIKC